MNRPQDRDDARMNRDGGLLNVLDLFSGCGGMSTGLRQAGGFRIVAACEWDGAAVRTYMLNHPGVTVIPKDITLPGTREEVCAAFDGIPCHVVAGGIPCQAYTKSKRRDPNDPRGRLYEPFIDVVARLLPSVVVIENVPNIMTYRQADGALVQCRINALLTGLGYVTGCCVLNAADFGVAQRRRRAFIFAWRRGTYPRPHPTHDVCGRNGLPKWPTIRDAIGDLEDAPEDRAWSHVFTQHKPHYLERLRRTPIGDKASVGYNEGAYRDAPDRPSRTLRGGAWLIHYRHDRAITGREAARLQGFPDGFLFSGTRSEVAQQIGNAVPPPMAKAVGLAVLEALGGAIDGAAPAKE